MAEVVSVTYRISGNSIAPILGSIDVSSMNNARAVVSGIPVGTKYLAELTAVSTDGKTTCTGMAEFDVAEGKTAQTMIVLGCKGTPMGTGGSGTGGAGGRGGAPGADGGVDAPSGIDAPVGTGGMVGSSGGAVGSGGATGSGGASASGGATGTGGASATGGAAGAAAGGKGGAAVGGKGGLGGAGGGGGGGGMAGATAGAGGGGGKGGAANGGTAGSAVGGSTSTGGAGTGGAGTGGAGTGGAGTGGASACIPTHCKGPACEQCTADNCIAATDSCDSIADPADRQLCESVYACFLANACVAQGDPLKCWCGTNPTTCVTSNAAPTKADGPCLNLIIMAAKLTPETYDAATIKARFVSTNYPLGYAVNETSCRGSFCSAECAVP